MLFQIISCEFKFALTFRQNTIEIDDLSLKSEMRGGFLTNARQKNRNRKSYEF